MLAPIMRLLLLLTIVAAMPVLLAGCGSAGEISAQRGGLVMRFDLSVCGVSYSGNTGLGPSAVDITCPRNLRVRSEKASLHLSVPLVTPLREVPLRDEHFLMPRHQLGHFVVLRYKESGRLVQCDPLMATGAIAYTAVPRRGGAGDFARLSGSFSPDAALLHCHAGQVDDGGLPVLLRGEFDVEAPDKGI